MRMYIRNELYNELRNDLLTNNGSNMETIIRNYIKKFVYVNNVISISDVDSIQNNATPPTLSSMTTSGTKITDTVTITHPQPRGFGIVGNRTFGKNDNYEISTVYLVDDTNPNNILVYGFMHIPNSSRAIGQIIFDETASFLLRIVYIPSYNTAVNMLSNIPYLVTTTFKENVSRQTKYHEISHSYIPSYLTKLTSQNPVYIYTKFKQIWTCKITGGIRRCQ